MGQADGLPTPVSTVRLLTSPFCPKAALGTHRQEHPGEEGLLGRQEKVSGGGSGDDHGETGWLPVSPRLPDSLEVGIEESGWPGRRSPATAPV